MKNKLILLIVMMFLTCCAWASDYQLINKEYQLYENDTWNDSLQINYSYYEENQSKLYEEEYSYRNNSQLEVVGRMRYYYDETFEMLIEKVWEAFDETWSFSYKYDYYYNDNDQIETTIYYEWNETDWLAYSKSTTSYDDEGNIIEDFWQYWQDEDTLIDWTKNNYDYDNQNIATDTCLLFYENVWIPYYRYQYSYEGNNNTEQLYQIGRNGVFNDSIKYVDEYTNDQLSRTELYQKYDTWYLMSYASYQYDENDNMTNELWQYDVEDETINYSQYNLSWNEIIVSNDNYLVNDVYTKSYPNPFSLGNNQRSTETIISFELKNSEKAKVSIYNLKGQKIVTLADQNFDKGKNLVRWNGKNQKNQQVPVGCYFYKIQGNKTIGSGKIMVVK